MSDRDETEHETPDGCVTALEHERRFTAVADWCEEESRRLAESMASDPDSKLGTAVHKMMDAALKARRAASALASAREDAAEARRIEQLEADLRRAG